MTGTVNQQRLSEGHFPFDLVVTVMGARGGAEHHSFSVHQTGLFIATDSPAPQQQLLRLMIHIPDQPAIEVWGSVDYVVETECSDYPQGMAVEFFSMDGKSEVQWTHLLDGLRGSPLSDDKRRRRQPTPAPVSRHTPMPLPAVPTGDTSVTVKPRDVRSLVRLINKDLAQGRIKVNSDQALPIGTPVTVVIRHPTTLTRVSVPAQVKHTHRDTILLRPTGLSRADWRVLQRFAVTGQSSQASQ